MVTQTVPYNPSIMVIYLTLWMHLITITQFIISENQMNTFQMQLLAKFLLDQEVKFIDHTNASTTCTLRDYLNEGHGLAQVDSMFYKKCKVQGRTIPDLIKHILEVNQPKINTAEIFAPKVPGDHNLLFTTSFKDHFNLELNKPIKIETATDKMVYQEMAFQLDPLSHIHAGLNKYIQRIDAYTQTKDQFAFGFWFFSKSRSQNRQVNYQLAKRLLDKANDPASIASVFSLEHVNTLRKEIALELGFTPEKGYADHGNNSAELKAVLRLAQQLFPLAQAPQTTYKK